MKVLDKEIKQQLNKPLDSILDGIADHAPKSRTIAKSNGIYRITVKTNSDGMISETETRLADLFHIIGIGQDSNGDYYRVIQWQDKITHQTKTAAIPQAEIGSNAGWQRLQRLGIAVMAGIKNREQLSNYIQETGNHSHYSITDKAGWHGNNYIMPSGEIITPAGERAENISIIYNGDRSQATAFKPNGTLEQWQENIAKYADGNSRLCLSLGVAFAAPLLALLKRDGGGFHLYGDSSDGKTTLSKAALSVWADETAYTSWNATAHAINNTALARNDCFIYLDEIGEAKNAKDIATTAYSLSNGKGRLQGDKDGGNRKQATFKTMFFSTGEHSLMDYMKIKQSEWHAGQNARLPSIPTTNSGYGAYENLHGFSDSRALAKQLERSYKHYHGTAGRAFIQQLANDPETAIEQAEALITQFTNNNQPKEAARQISRVTERFALVAAALELAAPITGLKAGVGMAGIKQCFESWIEENGTQNYEDKKIIEQAEDFLQQHGDSIRYVELTAHYTNSNHAGYRLKGEKKMEYWTTSTVFREEVAHPFPPIKAARVLEKAGLLKPTTERKSYQHQGKGRKWFYVLLEEIDPFPPQKPKK